MLVALLLGAFGILSCASSLQRASARYKEDRNESSLQVIAGKLHAGMTRAEVQALLGPPEYSPTDGQDYYSAKDSKRTLVVDYREQDKPTGRLHGFELVDMGE